MSRYAGGDTLAVATAAFLALAGSSGALAAHLGHTHRAAGRALVAAAAALIAVAATPIGNPPTPVGVTALHTIGGLVFYLATTRAMFTSASDAADRWTCHATAVILGLFFLGAVGVPGLRRIDGLLQRVVFVLVVGWMMRSGLR